jgi:hypothetical protein
VKYINTTGEPTGNKRRYWSDKIVALSINSCTKVVPYIKKAPGNMSAHSHMAVIKTAMILSSAVALLKMFIATIATSLAFPQPLTK